MSETETGAAAPEVIETATPEAEQVKAVPTQESTETPEGEEKQAPVEEKTFTQKELDEILQKRLAKAEARAERRATAAYREALEAVTRTQPQQPKAPAMPTRDQFASDDEWIDAKVEFRLQQRENEAKAYAQRATQAQLTTKTEDLYAKAEKLPDFDRETFDELPLTKSLAAALVDSDVGPQLMAYMSANPDEVARISKLSEVRQAAELGKLEVKLQASPKTTKAPAPISPVGAKGSTSPDVASMSMAEYKAYRAKQGARWAR